MGVEVTQFREIERRFRVYKEAPGFESIVGVEVTQLRERETEREREGERDASACIRRHQAFALPPVR